MSISFTVVRNKKKFITFDEAVALTAERQESTSRGKTKRITAAMDLVDFSIKEDAVEGETVIFPSVELLESDMCDELVHTAQANFPAFEIFIDCRLNGGKAESCLVVRWIDRSVGCK